MASLGGIKAGRTYVVLGADDKGLVAGLARAERRLKSFADGVNTLGRQLIGIGLAVAAPIGLAVKAFSSFEDEMAQIRANSNPTAENLARMEEAIRRISLSTGAGPVKVAQAMKELVKAGISVDEAVGGATEAMIQFAKVSGLDAEYATTTLAKAMHVFGVDATEAADAMSKAADSSAISVAEMATSFSQVTSVAGQAGLSIGETANAIAILGQNGVIGSDAGTSLKTMLLRLMAPIDRGATMFDTVGLEVRKFNKQMKNMPDIIAALQDSMKGLNSEQRDMALSALFGQDSIRAGLILTQKGSAAYKDYAAKIAAALPVSVKFGILMNTMSGFLERARSVLEEVSIAIGEALAPSFKHWGKAITAAARPLSALIKKNPQLVMQVAKLAAGALAAGAALLVLSLPLQAVAAIISIAVAGFGALAGVFGLLVTPVGLVAASLVLFVATMNDLRGVGRQAIDNLARAFYDLEKTVRLALGGIFDAMKAEDMKLAGDIMVAGMEVVQAKIARGWEQMWVRVWAGAKDSFYGFFYDMQVLWTGLWYALEDIMTKILKGGMAKQLIAFGAELKQIANYANPFQMNWKEKHKQIAEEARQQMLVVDDATDTEIFRKGPARKKEFDAIRAKQREEAKTRLNFGLAQVDTGPVDKAMAKLKGLTDEARRLANLPPPPPSELPSEPFVSFKINRKAIESLDPDLPKTLEAIARKFDVTGSFGAAAIAQQTFGSTIEDRQLEATNRTNRILEEIRRQRADSRFQP